MPKHVEELVHSLRTTLGQPLTDEINEKWITLYRILREANPGLSERRIDEMARLLVWGRR